MPKTRKRVEKTKEEIARGFEVHRKGQIVSEQFYPALVASTVSVDEAKMLIRAMSSFMMENVMQTMRDRKFSEIKDELLVKLCPDGDRKEEITKLLDILDGETLFVSREIVEGMTNAIDQMIQDEMKGRTLNSFEPDWKKMLNG